MEIDEVKQHLADEIGHLTFLQERLSEDGEPLSADEKQAIRRVLAGDWLHHMQQEAQLFFVSSTERSFAQNFEYTLNTLRQLM